MATRPRSARAAMAAAQSARRRVSDLGAPNRQSGNALRTAAAAGARPTFAKGTSKAYQNSTMRQIREARDSGRKINANAVHRKAVADHGRVYAGAAARNAARSGEGNANRRSGVDRRRS